MNEENSNQEKRIEEILKNREDWSVDSKTVDAFLEHLNRNLNLPCEVISMEDDQQYLLFKIEDSGDTMYGITGNVKLMSDKRRRLVIPLCDLEAI